MRKILSIQVLRGLAATMVAFAHVWLAVSKESPEPSLYQALGLERLGGLGVDIFFCISGFLMVVTLRPGLDRAPLAAAFMASRIKRIYPVYVVWLAVLLAGAALAFRFDFNFARSIDHVDVSQIVRNALLLPALPGDTTYYMYLPQAWTLVYEMYFYVVFALCLLAAGRRRIALSLALGLGGLFALFQWGVGQGDRHEWVSLRYMVGDPLVLNFLLGAVLGAIYGRTELRFEGTAARGGAAAAMGALLLVALLLPSETPRFWKFGVPALALLALAALYELRTTRLSGVVVYLGEASYSIYLTHIFFTFPAGRFARTSPLPDDADGLLLSLISVVFGCVAYSLLERPLTAALKGGRASRAAGPQTMADPAPP